MRIPYSKVYRAFPELDRFSDAECERFIVIARDRFAASMATGKVLAVLAFALVTPVFGMLWFGLGDAIIDWAIDPSRASRARFYAEDRWWYTLYIILGACLTPFAGGVAALYVRDRSLIRVISRQLITARCASCAYSLLGLQVVAGTVTCPECGAACVLADRGLTPQDIIAGP
jgi:hypothetical protein